MSDDVSSKAIGEIRKVAIDLGLYDADDWVVTRANDGKTRPKYSAYIGGNWAGY